MRTAPFANLSACGQWPAELLTLHAVRPHEREWAEGGCCRRRAINPWTPHAEVSEAMLITKRWEHDAKRLRLLVVLAADSGNSTRARTLANLASFSQVREASTTFLVTSEDCAVWRDVAAAAAVLSMPFECEQLPSHPSVGASLSVRAPAVAGRASGRAQHSASATVAFRPKLPLQLHATRTRQAHGLGDSFDAVWLPDADVAFTHEGVSAFLVRWACAFAAGPPYIAQPAMHNAESHAALPAILAI